MKKVIFASILFLYAGFVSALSVYSGPGVVDGAAGTVSPLSSSLIKASNSSGLTLTDDSGLAANGILINDGGEISCLDGSTTISQSYFDIDHGASTELYLSSGVSSNAGAQSILFYDSHNDKSKWGLARYSDNYTNANYQNALIFYQYNDKNDSAVNASRMIINDAGNVGFGTETPQRKLSVVGDVQVTGNIYESNFAIGEMYCSYNVTPMNIITANTYTVVTQNVTATMLTNFTFTNSGTDAYLTCLVAGLYEFNGSASFSGGNGDEFHGGISINNVKPEGKMEFSRKMGASGDVGSVSFSGLKRLAANDVIRLKIENATDADDPTVSVLNLVVKRVAP